MPKCSWKNKILQLRLSTLIFYILCLIVVIQFVTACSNYNYAHIAAEDIEHELYKSVNPNLVIRKTLPDCKYDEILKSTETINAWDVPKKYDDFSANGIFNGSYVPKDCNPLYSVAILVTYRNRQNHLDIFLPYMHNFLRKQNIHYKIYLIEQQDEKQWNKGALYNIGARLAIAEGFPCLVLHDVDLLPLCQAALYACTGRPRHMSAAIDKFRYVLTYRDLVGGVLAVRADHFTAVNGFSNRFFGWGGEDDDLAVRFTEHNLDVIRFPREMSMYTMLTHPQEPKSSKRFSRITGNSDAEGLRTVSYNTLRVVHQRLLTLIGVRF